MQMAAQCCGTAMSVTLGKQRDQRQQCQSGYASALWACAKGARTIRAMRPLGSGGSFRASFRKFPRCHRAAVLGAGRSLLREQASGKPPQNMPLTWGIGVATDVGPLRHTMFRRDRRSQTPSAKTWERGGACLASRFPEIPLLAEAVAAGADGGTMLRHGDERNVGEAA